MLTAVVAKAGPTLPVRMGRGTDVRIRATDKSGHPIATTLRAWIPGEEPGRQWDCPLDEEGFGVLRDIPHEPLELELLIFGWEPLKVKFPQESADGESLPLEFERHRKKG